MATNTNLGGVFTTDIDSKKANNVFLSTENVVGLIFDTSIMGGLTAALGTGIASKNFANGNVVELNTAKDIEAAGLDETVLAGVAQYHLDSLFALAGGTQRVFVSFMNSDEDKYFDAVEKMQLASGGIIYQIGVWTGKPIAEASKEKDPITDEEKTVYAAPTGNICSKLQAVAEVLGGKVGVTNYEGNAPLNILLCAPIVDAAEVDLKKLPDLSIFDYPKVTVLVGQAATESVHKLMFAVNHNTVQVEKEVEETVTTTNEEGEEVTETVTTKKIVDEVKATYAPVGCVGAALGCLAVAPANESIAHVNGFNLAAVMQNAELGFGKLTENETGDGYDESASFTNIKTLGYTKRNMYLHKNGYVFLTNYDGLENSIFFSSDQTLSTGDYRSIARCRVMHKSRRVVRRALLPRVHQNVEIDIKTGYLSASAVAEFQNTVTEALDLNMVEPGTQRPQISGRTCAIDAKQDVLSTDALDIQYMLIPLGVTGAINVTEGFTNKA